jgi:hypothetical protein
VASDSNRAKNETAVIRLAGQESAMEWGKAAPSYLGSNLPRRIANLPLQQLFAGIAMISFLASCITQLGLTPRSATLASGGICDPSYSGVQNARCLWVAAGESVGLQWDINTCVETEDGPIHNITKLDGETRQCTSRPMMAARGPSCALNTCYTGSLLADNQSWGPTRYPYGAGYFRKCTAPVDDECHSMWHSCQLVQRDCVGANANNYHYPACSLGCEQQIDQDQTLMLDASGYLYIDPVLISPYKFFAVSNTRRVARTATATPPESDLTAGPLVRYYQVPRADGGLEENFSPNLFISRVRAFTSPNPASLARNYLGLSEIRVDGGYRSIACPGSNADATVVSSDNCPDLGETTPTYVRAASSLSAPAVVWRIELLDGAHGGASDLTSNTPVFVEFTLASRPASGGNVTLRTASWDYGYNFGVLPSGAQRTDWGALKLDLADSAVRWEVESVSTSDDPAQEFLLQVEGPPYVNAGGVRNVSVTFRPSSNGYKAATGTITLKDSAGNRRSVPASLYAESGAQSIIVAPDTLQFVLSGEYDPNTGLPLPLPWRRRFLVLSASPSSILREDVTISGTGAASFSIHEGGTGNSPVTPAFSIPSQGGEVLSVDFCPTQYGTFLAEISVMGNQGTAANPIRAVKKIALQGTVQPGTMLCRPVILLPPH